MAIAQQNIRKEPYCSQLVQFKRGPTIGRVPLNGLCFQVGPTTAGIPGFDVASASSKIEGVECNLRSGVNSQVRRDISPVSLSGCFDREVLARLVAAAVFKTVWRRVNRVAGGFDSHALPLSPVIERGRPALLHRDAERSRFRPNRFHIKADKNRGLRTARMLVNGSIRVAQPSCQRSLSVLQAHQSPTADCAVPLVPPNSAPVWGCAMDLRVDPVTPIPL